MTTDALTDAQRLHQHIRHHIISILETGTALHQLNDPAAQQMMDVDEAVSIASDIIGDLRPGVDPYDDAAAVADAVREAVSEDPLDVEIHGARPLHSDEWTETTAHILLSYGGPNIWLVAPLDDPTSAWMKGAWGSSADEQPVITHPADEPALLAYLDALGIPYETPDAYRQPRS